MESPRIKEKYFESVRPILEENKKISRIKSQHLPKHELHRKKDERICTISPNSIGIFEFLC